KRGRRIVRCNTMLASMLALSFLARVLPRQAEVEAQRPLVHAVASFMLDLQLCAVLRKEKSQVRYVGQSGNLRNVFRRHDLRATAFRHFNPLNEEVIVAVLW